MGAVVLAAPRVAVCTCVYVLVSVMMMTPEIAGDGMTCDGDSDETGGNGMLPVPVGPAVGPAVGPEMKLELLVDQIPDEAPEGNDEDGPLCTLVLGVGRTVVMVTV